MLPIQVSNVVNRSDHSLVQLDKNFRFRPVIRQQQIEEIKLTIFEIIFQKPTSKHLGLVACQI